MYETTPQNSNKKSRAIVLCLFAGALAIFSVITKMGDVEYRWVAQLIAVLFLVAAIFVTTRYLTKTFIYSLSENEEGLVDLSVTEIQRKSRITVCRISLFSIEKIYVCDSKLSEREIKAEIKKEKRALFNYRVDIAPDRYICLFSSEAGENSAIYLSYDEELLKIISDYLDTYKRRENAEAE